MNPSLKTTLVCRAKAIEGDLGAEVFAVPKFAADAVLASQRTLLARAFCEVRCMFPHPSSVRSFVPPTRVERAGASFACEAPRPSSFSAPTKGSDMVVMSLLMLFVVLLLLLLPPSWCCSPG